MSDSPLAPLVGGILVGGESRRFGAPKALAELDGESFGERVARALSSITDEVVLLGSGVVPAALERLQRIPDASGLGGPLAGVLGFFRASPDKALLVAACDQALLEPAALDWLVALRERDSMAVMARWSAGGIEPVPAIYEPSVRDRLEALAAGPGSLQPLAGETAVVVERPPAVLQRSWVSIDTPEQLRNARR